MKIELHPSVTHARRALRGEPRIIRQRGRITDMYDKPELPPSNTSEQLAVRAAWRTGTAAWNAFSPEEKAVWSAAAKVTDTRVLRRSVERLSGYQHFQACAKFRQILGLPLLETPEDFLYPAELTSVELLPSADKSPTGCAFITTWPGMGLTG